MKHLSFFRKILCTLFPINIIILERIYMARTARKVSESNIYHIILRGVNKKIIFETPSDFSEFLYILRFYKDECDYDLYAYCLMDNHVHLLMGFPMGNLSEALKKIQDKYVSWYNKKYQRCGHLFQERFKSEPVDSDRYLLTVFRYIHQNPMKAGLEDFPGKFKWSSYYAYLHCHSKLVDTAFMKSYFSDTASLLHFLSEKNSDYCMEYTPISKSDSDAITLIKSVTNCESLSAIDTLPRDELFTAIRSLKKYGVTGRQINRLTGISRYTIDRILA